MGGDARSLFSSKRHSGQGQVEVRLRRLFVVTGKVAGAVAVTGTAAALLLTRWLAGQFLTLKPEKRRPLLERPESYGMVSQDVQVTTDDGLTLHGWYMPGRNGATVMIQHGSPGGRQDGLVEAAFLNKHGYNVLLGSFRAHDDCDGVAISFGYQEMKDIAAWHRHLLQRQDMDGERIGIFGESMGGAVAIRYAAANQGIAAVAVASAPAVMDEVVAMMVSAEVRAPRWSVAALSRLFVFWAERRAGCAAGDIDPLPHARAISPRPLLIIHGGDENRVPVEHGRLLYEAAAEPKAFWFVPEAGHVNFELFRPAEYERRLVDFFDQYLLADEERQ